MQWQKVSLIGVGLLGGSLGLALKQRGLAGHVHGYVRRSSSITECLDKRAVDAAGQDMREAVADADLIVLCTPLSQMAPLVESMAPHLKPGCLVTDVGSVKATVIEACEPAMQRVGCHFVGSHPMAGSEKVGVAHAHEDLFQNAACVVTPTERTSSEVVDRVRRLWTSVGGIPVIMPPEAHDELVGRSSHLTHLVAAELAHYVLDPQFPEQQSNLCATGFRDTTRIASGSPTMWCDISLANRKNLARELATLAERLQQFGLALEEEDDQAIQTFFEEAKRRRDAWCDAKASPSHE